MAFWLILLGIILGALFGIYLRFNFSSSHARSIGFALLGILLLANAVYLILTVFKVV